MIVTEIEDCGSGKRKVYLDGQPAFVLYRGELSGCHIEKDQELPEAVYREIIDEILWKRIRMRCLYLLKSMDRTEYQLRTKLKQNSIPRNSSIGSFSGLRISTISTMSAMRRAISGPTGRV